MWYLPFTSVDQIIDGAAIRFTFRGIITEGRIVKSSDGFLVILSNSRHMHSIAEQKEHAHPEVLADLRRFEKKHPSLKRYWYSHEWPRHDSLARLLRAAFAAQKITDVGLGPVGRILPNGLEVPE